MSLSEGEGLMMTTEPADPPSTLGQVFTSGPLTAGSGQWSSAGLLELAARFRGLGGTGTKGAGNTQGRWVDQEARRWEATRCNEDSRSCLTLSIGLLECVGSILR